MKKTLKISLILLTSILIATSVYAISCTMALQTAKNEYSPNDEFVVDVAISNMDVPDGIIALGATLEYDKNSLSLEKMEGQNSWSNPTYNEANGKLIMDRGSLGNKAETILKLTFKVKAQSASETTIAVKSITASGGETTGDIPINNISKKITIKSAAVDPTPNPPETNTTPPTNSTKPTNTTNTANTTPNTNTATNTNKNTTNTNTQNTSTNQTPTTPGTTTNNSGGSQGIVANTSNESTRDTKKTGVLPKTGTTRVLLIGLGVAVAVAVIFYVKIKILDVNVK